MRLSLDYWKVFSATVISSLGGGISGVAIPWIATSLTRDPVAITLITLAGQLPWIIFTLHAGVLIDRLDKKKILITMDVLRGVVTALVGLVIYLERGSLGEVTDIKYVVGTRWGLLIILILTSLIMGFASVLADTTSQSVMPFVVEKEQLQTANGRMWSAISASEQFIGPPIGSFLVGIAAFIPLLFDAGSFFLSAGLIFLVAAQFGKKREVNKSASFSADIKEGFNWLWSHKIFKTLALTLGLINLVNSLFIGSYILFAQEVLHVSVFQFAILQTGFAIGGIFSGVIGPKLAKKLGDARSLAFSMITMVVSALIIGSTNNWIVVWATGIATAIFITLWNIVTVSFRQSVIPEELFGRVNSVYRFFGTGGAPIGAALGAAIVSVSMHFISRQSALRLPFYLDATASFLIFLATRKSLSESQFQAARKAFN